MFAEVQFQRVQVSWRCRPPSNPVCLDFTHPTASVHTAATGAALAFQTRAFEPSLVVSRWVEAAAGDL